MSRQEEYIYEVLKEDYTFVESYRENDSVKISLYENRETGDKLIFVLSKIRNDDALRTLRGIENENLPTIYDVCSAEDGTIILEQYIEGESLNGILEKGPLDTGTAIAYCLNVCNALNDLHMRNIIHRDIKPLNVIINDKNRAVLIDYQAVRMVSESESKDTVNLGTVGYAAPEQFGIYQSVPATDIYALGVMLNEMLLKKHPSVEMPKGRIGKIIGKCTDISINNRYMTVNELAKDLKKCLKHA